ncbi:hypothetical protein WAK64_16150 [Bacillus spongiae]|uniref:Uncharacterized protein n=1 Tax=Bacillus spongiae TaxID=2683610 RepID=A0ABU8HGU0_9BACI
MQKKVERMKSRSVIDNAEKLLAKFITLSEGIINSNGISEVKHFFEHGEHEVAFEGLVIELSENGLDPRNFNYSDWKNLALEYGLDKESVFKADFWSRFKHWGKAYQE